MVSNGIFENNNIEKDENERTDDTYIRKNGWERRRKVGISTNQFSN